MTVEPGFGGQSFLSDQMIKVRTIRKLINEQNPVCELEVDGGVAPDTFHGHRLRPPECGKIQSHQRTCG